MDSFHQAATLHGLPASLLSDNGAVFTIPETHVRDVLRHNKTEGEGFEPSGQGLPAQQLSRLPHSTALPPLQGDRSKATGMKLRMGGSSGLDRRSPDRDMGLLKQVRRSAAADSHRRHPVGTIEVSLG